MNNKNNKGICPIFISINATNIYVNIKYNTCANPLYKKAFIPTIL